MSSKNVEHISLSYVEVLTVLSYLNFYCFSPGWPPSAACRPQTSWMITRCARCCLIWSQPTMPLTASSTPPKAFIHHWFYLSLILTLSLKSKKKLLLSLYGSWKGVNLCWDRYCCPLCLSKNATRSLAYQASPVLWHPPLPSTQTCVITPFITGCLLCPSQNSLFLNLYCTIKKV